MIFWSTQRRATSRHKTKTTYHTKNRLHRAHTPQPAFLRFSHIPSNANAFRCIRFTVFTEKYNRSAVCSMVQPSRYRSRINCRRSSGNAFRACSAACREPCSLSASVSGTVPEVPAVERTEGFLDCTAAVASQRYAAARRSDTPAATGALSVLLLSFLQPPFSGIPPPVHFAISCTALSTGLFIACPVGIFTPPRPPALNNGNKYRSRLFS